jgi:hypothetical protein
MDASTVSLSEVEVCSIYILLCCGCFVCCSLTTCLTNCVAAYMSSPCHIELILSEKEEPVKKEVCGCAHCLPPLPTIQYIYINTVVLIVDCLLFRQSLRLQPGRLREGNSSALLEWICSFSLAEWKFWPIICRHFLSVYCYAKLIHLLP